MVKKGRIAEVYLMEPFCMVSAVPASYSADAGPLHAVHQLVLQKVSLKTTPSFDIVCYQTVAKRSQKSINVDRFLQVHFATQ